MAISGILTTQNHYNQRASGLWPTIFTSAALPNTQWISTLSTTSTNEFYGSVKVDSSGNVYCLSLLNSTDIVLVKYNSAGTIQFQKKYTNSSSSTSFGFSGGSLFIDSSNNVYMTGGYVLGGYYSGFVIKTDSTGSILYQKRFYAASSAENLQANGIAVDSTGNAYIIGTSQGFPINSGQIAYLLKLDSSGTGQWSINFDARTSTGSDLVIDSSDNVLMSGYSTSGGGSSTVNQHYIVKINSAGSSVWQAGISSSSGYVLGQGISLDSSNNIYITGGHYGSYYSVYTAKVNSSGSSVVWGKIYDAAGSFGSATVTDSTGNSYTGSYYPSGNDNRSVIMKHDSSGTLQWQRVVNKVNTTDSDFRTVLDLDNTGDFYGAGSATNTTDQDSIVYKLPTDGTKTGTYTVGGRSIVYGSASFPTQAVSLSIGSNPSHTLITGGLTVGSVTFTVSDHTATSSTTTV
jgi:hypothetical protein